MPKTKEQDSMSPPTQANLESPEVTCPEGSHYDKVAGTCIHDITGEPVEAVGVVQTPPLSEEEGPEAPECGEDEVYNPVSKQCEPIPEAVQHMPEIFQRGTKMQLKAVFEKILTYADNHVRNMDARLKTVTEIVNKDHEIIYELHHKLRNDVAKSPQLKETTDKVKSLEQRITEMENAYSHIKGTFKAHNKLIETKEGPALSDPLTGNKT